MTPGRGPLVTLKSLSYRMCVRRLIRSDDVGEKLPMTAHADTLGLS